MDQHSATHDEAAVSSSEGVHERATASEFLTETEQPESSSRRRMWLLIAGIVAVVALLGAPLVAIVAGTHIFPVAGGSASDEAAADERSCFLLEFEACATSSDDALVAEVERAAGIGLPAGTSTVEAFSVRHDADAPYRTEQVAVLALPQGGEPVVSDAFTEVPAPPKTLQSVIDRTGVTVEAPVRMAQRSAADSGGGAQSTVTLTPATSDEGEELLLVLVASK